MVVEKRPPVFTTVDQLRPDTSGHTLKLKVVDSKLVFNRPGRPNCAPFRIAECTAGDQTGVITLTARNELVDIAKPGQYITIRNARIDMFRGSMRLSVNQWGKMEPEEDLGFEPKMDNNLSHVEYELVQVPASTAAPSKAPAPAEAARAVPEAQVQEAEQSAEIAAEHAS